MKQRTVIIGGVVVTVAAVLLATAAFQTGYISGLESQLELPPPAPTPAPTPTPASYTITIKSVDQNGKFDIQPDIDTQWTLHPTDTITFLNKTGDTVKVFPKPENAYVGSTGPFDVPPDSSGGKFIVKTVNGLPVGGNPLVITNSFGDPSNIRGPRMVVTPSQPEE